jgi:hypothetical protein
MKHPFFYFSKKELSLPDSFFDDMKTAPEKSKTKQEVKGRFAKMPARRVNLPVNSKFLIYG